MKKDFTETAVSANAGDGLTQNVRPGCIRPRTPFIPFPSEAIQQTICQRFEAVVRSDPERLAIKVGAESVTYGQLDQKAGRLAHALIESVRSSREQIAVLARPGMALVIGLLATLKAGGVCVPLDPSYPPARIQHILEDAQVGTVIVENKGSPAARLLRDRHSVLSTEDCSHDPAGTGVRRNADSPCFLLYTSGSTGQPKGVIYNHRDFLHLVRNTTNSLHIAAEDRISLLAPSGTIAAQEDIFRALLNGAALFPFYVPEEGLMRMPHWLLEEEITVYHSVPTLFRHFAETLKRAENFPRLRLIQLGGEAVYRRDVELYRKNFADNCLLVTGLGATEVANVAHYFFDKNTPMQGAVAPAGYAAADREIFLLDDAGQAVEAGEVGEIAVKSRYLSRGYWRRPELTAAAFHIADDDPSAAVYRTGDLGRISEDGCLFHLGRNDFMVKIHGRRVEVAEVETTLLQNPEIAHAAVISHQVDAGDRRLVACLVPRPTAELSAGQLRCQLQVRLPDYMIPSEFVMLDEMPLTATGKIDRVALLSRLDPKIELAHNVVPSREPIEKMLVDIWTKLLGSRPSGDNDSFFDLGGDSLSAILLLAEIEKRTGIRLASESLLQAPTIRKLASKLIQRGTGNQPYRDQLK